MNNEEVNNEDSKQAAEFSALEAEIIEAEQEEKEEQEGVSNSDIISPLISALFAIIAPNWAVSQEEVSKLAMRWGEVADKYIGNIPAGAEGLAIIETLGVVAPKIGTPRKLKEEDEEAGKEAVIMQMKDDDKVKSNSNISEI